ncbi:MAG: T9SS type A sorting domain-containing protein [Flavipsychrobacter sp.]
MKKLFSLFFTLSFFLAIHAHGQVRNINLEVKLLTPQNNDILYVTKQFDITTQIKNLGPDTITTNDTAAWYLSFNGGQIQFGSPPMDHINYPTPNLLPGDSAQVRIQFTLNQGWSTGTSIVCSKMELKNATDSIVDNDTTNNTSCASTDVRDLLSVSNLSSTIKDISVYPNPASDVVNFDLMLSSKTDVSIWITDITGKVILHSQHNGLAAGQQKLKISLDELPTGNYLYKLQTNSGIKYGKLAVE